MRLVQVTIPPGTRDAVRRVLDDEGIDYVVSEETSNRDYVEVISFPLPPGAVEPVLDRLRDAGIGEQSYTIILDAETVISRRSEALAERYAEDDTARDRISREEVAARAADLSPSLSTFVAMATASVLIATAGVLLDSAAVVVGSMVIAPLIGPAMATSVGTVVQDRELFHRGVRLQVLGFVLSVVVAAGFAWVLRSIHLVPLGPMEVLAIGEVEERLAPDFLSLAVALVAGFAGAYSLSSGVSSSLVGVAIAIALVPPTAVIGIGIAWGLPALVVGSTVLVLVNFASINFAALATLWYQGYRPERWFEADAARVATIKRLGVLVGFILLLSLFLGGATLASFQSANVENEVRDDVVTVLDRPAYDELRLIELTVEQGGLAFAPQPERVVVTVGVPPGAAPSGLADALAAQINEGDRALDVEVRFVTVETQAAG